MHLLAAGRSAHGMQAIRSRPSGQRTTALPGGAIRTVGPQSMSLQSVKRCLPSGAHPHRMLTLVVVGPTPRTIAGLKTAQRLPFGTNRARRGVLAFGLLKEADESGRMVPLGVVGTSDRFEPPNFRAIAACAVRFCRASMVDECRARPGFGLANACQARAGAVWPSRPFTCRSV